MFTVAELQPSPCSHQVTLTPFHHVHIVHRVHRGHPRHLNMFTLYTAASWARALTPLRPPHQHRGTADLQAVASVFSRLQHHRSPECVH